MLGGRGGFGGCWVVRKNEMKMKMLMMMMMRVGREGGNGMEWNADDG